MVKTIKIGGIPRELLDVMMLFSPPQSFPTAPLRLQSSGQSLPTTAASLVKTIKTELPTTQLLRAISASCFLLPIINSGEQKAGVQTLNDSWVDMNQVSLQTNLSDL